MRKFLGAILIALMLSGCGSEHLYAIDFANPQLVKQADRVEYTHDALGHFYDKDPKDVALFIDVLQHMGVQKIKPDPLVTGGSYIGLFKGNQEVIGIGFAQHISINDNSYQYHLDSHTDEELRQLEQNLSSSSHQP